MRSHDRPITQQTPPMAAQAAAESCATLTGMISSRGPGFRCAAQCCTDAVLCQVSVSTVGKVQCFDASVVNGTPSHSCRGRATAKQSLVSSRSMVSDDLSHPACEPESPPAP